MRRDWFCLLYTLSSGVYTHWSDPSQAFTSLGWTLPDISLFWSDRCSSPLIIFTVLHWTCPRTSLSALVLVSPQLNPELQMWPHQCWTEGNITFLDILEMLFKSAQNVVCFLCLQGTLLAQHELAVHHDLQVLFCEAAFYLVGPQSVLVHEDIPHLVQNLMLSFVELLKFPLAHFSNFSISPWVAAHLTTPHSLVNVLTVHSASPFRSLMKTLNSDGTNIDTCATYCWS